MTSKEYRTYVTNQIANLVKLLGNNGCSVNTYVYRGFLHANGYVEADDTYCLVNGEQILYCEMRTRDLRRLRNALARDYGKLQLRKAE